MRQSRAKPARANSMPDRCRDWIEQKIIRAYVQLAVSPNHAKGSRTATLLRYGALELRMRETRDSCRQPTLPSYRLEIYSSASGSIVASREFCEFDESELAAAVAFVCLAKQNLEPH
jgi:hypothetical protein